jgi:hypothetical protein
MRQFPFRILGFHSDNGSEFINRIVARLLNKLLIEQTGETPTLRVVAAAGERAVEMTEPENPQKQNRGFPASLESAKNKGALSTFLPPRLRLLDWFRIYP